jgi:hypothetical protein
MEEINNDEIINFLIEKYPSNNTFEDKMEKKLKKFERKMDPDASTNLYVKTIYPSSNDNSWCMSKLIIWLLVFLFVVFMAVMICKK